MYEIEFANAARRDFGDIVDWYAARNPAQAARIANDLRVVAARDLGKNPERYPFFWITGQPYRGRLYQLSRQTSFWIVYRVDHPRMRVEILRIWNASRDPAAFEL
jgi:plasmid stabilization system protein ParE